MNDQAVFKAVSSSFSPANLAMRIMKRKISSKEAGSAGNQMLYQ